jgi:hypothetical protein
MTLFALSICIVLVVSSRCSLIGDEWDLAVDVREVAQPQA